MLLPIPTSVTEVSVFPDVDAARITTLDIDMLYHESWKPIYFEVKFTRHKNVRAWFLYSCECWLLLVLVALLS